MKTVYEIIDDIIRTEGGFSNDPADSGGETNFGWTRKALREMGWFGAVRDLDRATAVDLYYRRFITNSGYEPLMAQSTAIVAELVDTSVNMGEVTATKFLQRALNALNDGARIYPDITVDGKCGPATVRTVTKFLQYRGAEGELVLLRCLNCMQGARYAELAEMAPKNERFFYGWMLNRVML